MADNSIILTPAPQITHMQNWITAVVDTMPDARQAMQELRAAGFSDDHLMLLDGAEGVRAFEAQQKSQGRVRDFFNRLERGANDTSTFADEYVEEGSQGHINLWVYAPTPEQVAQAQQILQAHGGRLMKYNTTWTTEQLSPQENAPQ